MTGRNAGVLRATHGAASVALAMRVSMALAAVAAIVGSVSFVFWQLFYKDVPAGVGNLRGTALTLLVVALPLLLISMRLAARGSSRAHFVWLGSLAYMGYNAVLFLFAASFNSLFLLYTTFLALAFWALVTLIRALDVEQLAASAAHVPVRTIVAYLLVCLVAFAALWLQSIVPSMIDNSMPQSISDAGLTQNGVWVLDFSFTFPLMLLGAIWLWRRRPWGFVISGMMVIMLTIETASIAVDQYFGNLHDPSASAAAVPVMIGFTVAGALMSALFLRRQQGR